MAVHHFNVPVAPDVSDRFMVLHYTDWESLNGRNINNWVRAEATPCSLRYDWAAGLDTLWADADAYTGYVGFIHFWIN